MNPMRDLRKTDRPRQKARPCARAFREAPESGASLRRSLRTTEGSRNSARNQHGPRPQASIYGSRTAQVAAKLERPRAPGLRPRRAVRRLDVREDLRWLRGAHEAPGGKTPRPPARPERFAVQKRIGRMRVFPVEDGHVSRRRAHAGSKRHADKPPHSAACAVPGLSNYRRFRIVTESHRNRTAPQSPAPRADLKPVQRFVFRKPADQTDPLRVIERSGKTERDAFGPLAADPTRVTGDDAVNARVSLPRFRAVYRVTSTSSTSCVSETIPAFTKSPPHRGDDLSRAVHVRSASSGTLHDRPARADCQGHAVPVSA